jgi:hypothetical protein
MLSLVWILAVALAALPVGESQLCSSLSCSACFARDSCVWCTDFGHSSTYSPNGTLAGFCTDSASRDTGVKCVQAGSARCACEADGCSSCLAPSSNCTWCGLRQHRALGLCVAAGGSTCPVSDSYLPVFFCPVAGWAAWANVLLTLAFGLGLSLVSFSFSACQKFRSSLCLFVFVGFLVFFVVFFGGGISFVPPPMSVDIDCVSIKLCNPNSLTLLISCPDTSVFGLRKALH